MKRQWARNFLDIFFGGNRVIITNTHLYRDIIIIFNKTTQNSACFVPHGYSVYFDTTLKWDRKLERIIWIEQFKTKRTKKEEKSLNRWLNR